MATQETVHLETVETIDQLRESIRVFNDTLRSEPDRVENLVKQTSYWVYDADRDEFGPSKFVGFQKLTLAEYDYAIRTLDYSGQMLSGGVTRKAIEKIFRGPYRSTGELANRLRTWVARRLEGEPLLNVSDGKWKFQVIGSLEQSLDERLLESESRALEDQGAFELPNDEVDGRRRIMREIALRAGQSDFRKRRDEASKDKCAISECDVREALEAAHIHPYKGPQSHHAQNGLLLRADLHALFDRKLFAIRSSHERDGWVVEVHPQLRATDYKWLDGARVRLPQSEANWPSREACEKHRSGCKFEDNDTVLG